MPVCSWLGPIFLAGSVHACAGAWVPWALVGLVCWTWSWQACEWPAAQSTRLSKEQGRRALRPHVLSVLYVPIDELVLSEDPVHVQRRAPVYPPTPRWQHIQLGSLCSLRLWAHPRHTPPSCHWACGGWAWAGLC